MPGELVSDEILQDESGEWGESECLVAFEHLHQLQNQLDDLRTSIPDLLSTFANIHNAPEDLYGLFDRAASSAAQAVKDLKTSWKDEKTRRIFNYADNAKEAPEELYVNIRQWDWDIDSILGRGDDRMQEDWINVEGMMGMEDTADDGLGITSTEFGPLVADIQQETSGHADTVTSTR